MIAAIEFRSEEDPDVARYTHQKNIDGGEGGRLQGGTCLFGLKVCLIAMELATQTTGGTSSGVRPPMPGARLRSIQSACLLAPRAAA